MSAATPTPGPRMAEFNRGYDLFWVGEPRPPEGHAADGWNCAKIRHLADAALLERLTYNS